MFNEDEDWNDEQDARVLSETVLKNLQETTSTGVKPKTVGKKSLLRTLKTLGAVPEWKSDDHQQSSDSEVEALPSHRTKKKKNRRKKREHAETSAEQQDNRDPEEKPATKKKKKENISGSPKTNGTSADGDTKSANMEVKETENTKKLSRQQWKNKMKNKKKCKNKYRQNEPEEKVHQVESVGEQGTKEEVKTDSISKNSNEKITQAAAKKKHNEHKPQTVTEEDTQKQTQREEKQQTLKEKTKKISDASKVETKSFPDESKRKAGEAEVEIADDQQHTKGLRTELSKKQSQKRDKLRKMLQSQKVDQQQSPRAKQEDEPAAPENEPQQAHSASLRSRMEQRLESARFRYINEVLYSTSSGEAKRMFKQDPQAFWTYHRGYTAQVQKWPINPVDAIISYIRRKPSSLVVADFGCGDCKIARSVTNKVHSFDLAATCELVTVCDMANVPLGDASVDIAVFCLSLMGTNLADFISEANRVLKMGGVLKIAEVSSRFEDARSFLSALAKLGFKTVSKDTDNTHFYSFEFVKAGNCPQNVKKSGLQLKPCVYKKR